MLNYLDNLLTKNKKFFRNSKGKIFLYQMGNGSCMGIVIFNQITTKASKATNTTKKTYSW